MSKDVTLVRFLGDMLPGVLVKTDDSEFILRGSDCLTYARVESAKELADWFTGRELKAATDRVVIAAKRVAGHSQHPNRTESQCAICVELSASIFALDKLENEAPADPEREAKDVAVKAAEAEVVRAASVLFRLMPHVAEPHSFRKEYRDARDAVRNLDALPGVSTEGQS